jgi:hypothetical protein
MAHSLTNPKARQSLAGKLKHAFREATSHNGYVSLSSDEFARFTNEAIKSVEKWMSLEDIYGLVFSHYLRLYSGHQPLSLPGDRALKDHLEEEDFAYLAEEIVADLASVPKSYRISFPFRSIKFAKDYEICNSVSLRRIVAQPGLLGATLETDKTFVDIKSSGFMDFDRAQSAFRQASTSLKLFCVTAQVFGLITASPATRRPMGLLAFASDFSSEVAHFALIQDGKNTHKVQLGVGISKYFDSIACPVDENSEEFTRTLNLVKQICRMLEDPAAQPNVQSIKRALEWAFDARIDEDETTAFVKTCIGLEAALAEQSEEIGITAQLADRCSFLLASTHENRAALRERVRTIYKLRSKFVHGAQTALTREEAELARTARELLVMVIRKELSSSFKWWAAQHEETGAASAAGTIKG